MDTANNALITLSDLKLLSGIAADDTSNDAKLQFMVNAASQEIETIIGHKLGKSDYVEKIKGNNRLTIQVKNYPLLAIESIKVNDDIVDSSGYMFDSSGIIERIGGIWGSNGLTYGISNGQGQRTNNIEIAYTGGYVLPKDATEEDPRTLPYDLELACFQMINGLLALSENGAIGLKSFSISDVSWTWDKEYMQSILPTLMKYRTPRL